MKGRLILVGASGTIGTATLDAAVRMGLDVVPTYRTRALPKGIRFDLETDSPSMLNIRSCDALIIFAAYSDQEWVRTHPAQSRSLNVAATARLAIEAVDRKAWVAFLSSEAVFGTSRDSGWDEAAEPCPSTEYGRQKYELEKILCPLAGACVVRTGWNVSLRPNDRCVVRSTYQSMLEGSARLAVDNVFSLTDVNDTAGLLIQLANDRAEGIVHAVSGIPVSRTAMADEIIRTSAKGGNMRYKAIRYSNLTFREPRPACSWLVVTRSIPAFSPPPNVIAKKVKVLDSALAE